MHSKEERSERMAPLLDVLSSQAWAEQPQAAARTLSTAALTGAGMNALRWQAQCSETFMALPFHAWLPTAFSVFAGMLHSPMLPAAPFFEVAPPL